MSHLLLLLATAAAGTAATWAAVVLALGQLLTARPRTHHRAPRPAPADHRRLTSADFTLMS
jgi:hypothetical protein